jgi:hypothetical protein
MAFGGSFMCTSFKQQLMRAEHNFDSGHTFNMSLYDNSATLDADTTVYTASGELADATGGYDRPGEPLEGTLTPAIGSDEAWTDFTDEVWGTATFSAYGALIYNDTHATDGAVVVLDFGGVQTATAGDFTVQFPAAAATAIIRIA